MLGSKLPKEIPGDIKKWSYEKTRYNLLLKSAGFNRLINRLKVQFNLNKISKRELEIKMLVCNDLGIKSPLKDILDRVCAELNITREFLERVIQNEYDGFDVGGDSLPIYISTGLPFRDGFYIRVDAHTHKKTVEKAYDEIKTMWQQNRNYSSETKNIGLRRKSKISSRERKQENLGVQYYRLCLIEDKIYSLLEEIGTNGRLSSLDDDLGVKSSDAIVKIAIEETSDILVRKKLVGSKTFADQKSETESKYYKTLDHYLIPTLMDFENFHLN